METKAAPIESLEIEERRVKALFSVFGAVDSVDDIIQPGAFAKTLTERSDRVRVLWQHDTFEPPIGVPHELREIDRAGLPDDVRARWPEATGALWGEIELLDTPRGNEVLSGIKAGAIRENSIGFDVLQSEPRGAGSFGRVIRELRLWDISPVNWGAQPAAVMVKSALPYKDTGTADMETTWETPALSDFTDQQWDDLSDDEKSRIAAHYAWRAEPVETFADLKLPHHQPSKDGIGEAVWRGVAAAMSALLGARGGVDIPDDDRRGVYNHLQRHYEQFDKEPPDFKLLELSHNLRDIERAGIGAADVDRFMATVSELRSLIEAAEPLENPALTAKRARALLLRAELSNRDYQLIG